METRSQIDNRRLQEVRIVFAEIELAELIRQPQTPVVGYVEEVSNEADASALVDHPRIIRVQIELSEERRAPKFAAPAYRNLTGIQVNRMRQILADRYSRFHVETHAEIQARSGNATEAGAIATEAVARIDVRHEATIGIEMTNLELIAEQVEVSFREVE